jgi:hypothetical protein
MRALGIGMRRGKETRTSSRGVSRGATIIVASLIAAHPAGAQVASTLAKRIDASPAQAVEQFHSAIATGDTAVVARLLDAGAVILESGDLETRAEYLSHHLSADVAFSRDTKTARNTPRVTQSGAAAWVASTSRVTGTFEGRPVDSDGAELIVLRRTGTTWRIVAIHWSSHRHRAQ